MNGKRLFACVGLTANALCLVGLTFSYFILLTQPPGDTPHFHFDVSASEGTKMQVVNGSLELVGAGSISATKPFVRYVVWAMLAFLFVASTIAYVLLLMGSGSGRKTA